MRAIRIVLLLLFVTGVGGAMAVTATTSAPTPATSSEADGPTFLFVQQAAGGTFAMTDAGEWTLTLAGTFPQTVYFSDRPAREAGTLPTAEFLALDGLFAADNPPNAAVVLADPASQRDDVLVVALRDPAYDPAAGILCYAVTVLEEIGVAGLSPRTSQADPALPGEFGHVTLFVDGTLIPCETLDCSS